MKCPCCSKKLFLDCCGPLLSGEKKANSPEELMRSRYSAYFFKNIDYLKKTSAKQALKNFQFPQTLRWTSLKILRVPEVKDNIGWVEFKASYVEEKNLLEVHKLHELSEFHLIDDQWLYTGGIHF